MIDEIIARFPTTFKLTIVSTLVSVVIGITLGIISAVKQYSIWDNIVRVIAMVGVSMPNFWVWSSGGYCLCSESWLAAFSGYGRGWSRAA